MTSSLPLKIANVLAYLLFLGSSIYVVISPQPIYVVTSPQPIYEISPQPVYENIKQTYFTPTIWAFLVWPVIQILLLCTVVAGSISWAFPLLNILFAIFVIVWVNQYHTAAFVVSFFLVSCNNTILVTLPQEEHFLSLEEDVSFVRLSVAVCKAWSVVMFFLTAFEAFGVDATEHPDGIWTKILVFCALFILQFDAILLANSKNGFLAALTLSWTLWTISDNQRSSAFIHWSALVFCILSLIVRGHFCILSLIVRGHFYFHYSNSSSSFRYSTESAPLLGR